MYSDQQLFNTIQKITDTKHLFSTTGFSLKEPIYKNRRDQLIKELTRNINIERKKAGFRRITEKWLAIKCNSNPFLISDDELDLVKKQCEKKGNYKRLFWLLK